MLCWDWYNSKWNEAKQRKINDMKCIAVCQKQYQCRLSLLCMHTWKCYFPVVCSQLIKYSSLQREKKRARELPIQLTKHTYRLHYCTKIQYYFDSGTITTITNTCEWVWFWNFLINKWFYSKWLERPMEMVHACNNTE